MRAPLITILVIVLLAGIALFIVQSSKNEVQSTQTNDSSQEIPASFTVLPQATLNGEGSNVDSLAFWEADDVSKSLLFVTSKAANLVEVWQYPFEDNEQEPLRFQHSANGVIVDQTRDVLYVGLREPPEVHALSLPSFETLDTFGDELGPAETNFALFEGTSPTLYVSDNNHLYAYDALTDDFLFSFAPSVSSIETALADDFYNTVYVPDEQGGSSDTVGVYAYTPDGKPLLKEGTNLFGDEGIFQADEEGILLYRCLASSEDTGEGFIVVADQKTSATEFEFFDRKTWKHLTTMTIEGVSNTDGIASTQQAFPLYPKGIFAAVNNDATAVLVGWDAIFEASGLACP